MSAPTTTATVSTGSPAVAPPAGDAAASAAVTSSGERRYDTAVAWNREVHAYLIHTHAHSGERRYDTAVAWNRERDMR